MSGGVPGGGAGAAAGVVDGVDVDAVASAVRGCGGVDDLCSGPWGGVVSYLPGRQVPGVRVAPDHVLISVRGRWGVPVADLAGQIRGAVGRLAAPRRVDIVVADLSDGAAGTPAGGQRDEVSSWMSSPGGMPAVSSSAPITPTTGVTPPLS